MSHRAYKTNHRWRPSGLQILWVSTCLLLAGFCLVQAAPQASQPRLELCGVADFQPGDKVLAFNHETGQTEARRVLHTMQRVSDHLRILTVASVDGTAQEFQTTDKHPFWVVGRDEYVEANELRPGDNFRTMDGELLAVTASVYEPHPGGIAVYNFEVEGLHNYFVKRHGSRAPPVLAHNASCVPNPWGSRGSPAHQAKILQAEIQLNGRGWKTIAGGSLPEKLFGKRRPDLVLEKGGKQIAIQVGKRTKQGRIPIARERAAMADLRALTDPKTYKPIFDHVFFIEF